MGRESSITLEQVSTIANEIKTSGGKATSRAVRDALGSGSMATICKLLAQWQASQERKSEAIDDSLSQAVAKAISNDIASKVQSAIADATSRLADLQSEHDLLITENENQTADIEFLSNSLSSEKEQNSKLSGRVQQLETDAMLISTKLDKERGDAKSAMTALAKAELRLEALPRIEQELTSLRNQIEIERTRSATLHEKEAVASAKLEMLSSNHIETSKRLEIAQEELGKEKLASQSLQNRLDITTRDFSKANAAIEKLAGEIKQLQKSLSMANKEKIQSAGRAKKSRFPTPEA